MLRSTLASLLLAAGIAAGPAAPAVAAGHLPPPRIAGCRIFPATNVWNQRVDGLPVRADSDALKASIGLDAYLHPDFGSSLGYGIPWNVVRAATPRARMAFRWPDESDRVRYPIPAHPRIEGGSDRHILMVDGSRCRLYELFAARRLSARTASARAAGRALMRPACPSCRDWCAGPR